MCALADAGDSMRSPAARMAEAGGKGAETGRAEEEEVLTADELNVADVSMNPLEYKSVVAEPRGKHAVWKSHLSHLLDGLSALFSLACGSATLACMGVLEWSTLATMVAFVGYLSTVVGSLMVLATAVVGVLALFDTVRTSGPGPEQEVSALDDGSLQALAAPPRRLGSMGARLGSTGGGRIGSSGSRH